MIANECEFTGITKEFCSHCIHGGTASSPAPGRPRTVNRGPSDLRAPCMEAAFDSNCPECGCSIEEGDMIAKRDDQWVCAPCGYVHDEAAAKAAHPSGRTPSGWLK